MHTAQGAALGNSVQIRALTGRDKQQSRRAYVCWSPAAPVTGAMLAVSPARGETEDQTKLDLHVAPFQGLYSGSVIQGFALG